MATNGKAHPDTSIVTVDAVGRDPHDAVREELHARRARARDRPAPDWLCVQAVRARRRVRAGRAAHPDVLEHLAVLQPPLAGRGPLRLERRRKRSRSRRPVDRHRGFDQRRVRAADPRHRPGDRAPGRIEDGRHQRAAARRRAGHRLGRGFRSTWPWASRRWPTGRALHALHDPDHRARREAALRARARLRARPSTRHRPPDLGDAPTRPGQRHRSRGLQRRLGPLAGRREDRHRRPQQGGVVLWVHAAARHRGLGGVERHPTRSGRSSVARSPPRSGAAT